MNLVAGLQETSFLLASGDVFIWVPLGFPEYRMQNSYWTLPLLAAERKTVSLKLEASCSWSNGWTSTKVMCWISKVYYQRMWMLESPWQGHWRSHVYLEDVKVPVNQHTDRGNKNKTHLEFTLIGRGVIASPLSLSPPPFFLTFSFSSPLPIFSVYQIIFLFPLFKYRYC